MKKTILLIAMLLSGAMLMAQNTEVVVNPTDNDEEVFLVVEDEPEFPGGMEALYKYLASNIKYPAAAKEQKIQGHVIVNFVIEKDGSVSNIKLLRDIGGGCGEEAIRVVQAMPKWKPARLRGKRVRAQFNLPINFNLK